MPIVRTQRNGQQKEQRLWVVMQDGVRQIAVANGPAAALQFVTFTVDYYQRRRYTVCSAKFDSAGILRPTGGEINAADERFNGKSDDDCIELSTNTERGENGTEAVKD
jgi:hypothetical protein